MGTTVQNRTRRLTFASDSFLFLVVIAIFYNWRNLHSANGIPDSIRLIAMAVLIWVVTQRYLRELRNVQQERQLQSKRGPSPRWIATVRGWMMLTSGVFMSVSLALMLGWSNLTKSHASTLDCVVYIVFTLLAFQLYIVLWRQIELLSARSTSSIPR